MEKKSQACSDQRGAVSVLKREREKKKKTKSKQKDKAGTGGTQFLSNSYIFTFFPEPF